MLGPSTAQKVGPATPSGRSSSLSLGLGLGLGIGVMPAISIIPRVRVVLEDMSAISINPRSGAGPTSSKWVSLWGQGQGQAAID